MRHIIAVTVENRFGVLSRISGLFAGRGYNISSLAVNTTDESQSVSTIILTVKGDDAVIEQVKKQLNRLIDIIKVTDLTETDHIERELILIKVSSEKSNKRAEILQLCDVFRANVIGVNSKKVIIELLGGAPKLDAFIHVMEPYGITEVVRTGIIAMAR